MGQLGQALALLAIEAFRISRACGIDVPQGGESCRIDVPGRGVLASLRYLGETPDAV